MEIGGIQKTTLIDYPGKLACTVFLIKCNFFCPWCYSRELVLPEEIKKQPRIPEEEFFDFLKQRQGMIEGVVICGGEPTINKDLPQFIRRIKQLGFSVKLDTNGSNPEMLKKLIEGRLLDYVAVDIKLPREKYPKVFAKGVKVENIEKSIEILKEGKIDCEFRTTIVPGIHTREDILKIAEWLKGAKKYYLQNFRPEKTIDPRFEKVKPYSKDFLLEIKREVSPFFKICEVR